MNAKAFGISLCTLLLAVSTSVLARDNVKCQKHPEHEWKPHTELQRKLESDGWQIRRMEKTATCYEVYGKDPQGKRVEAFFDPKTFDRVEPK